MKVYVLGNEDEPEDNHLGLLAGKAIPSVRLYALRRAGSIQDALIRSRTRRGFGPAICPGA